LAGAALPVTTALPAIAATAAPDPIFASIEARKCTYVLSEEAIGRVGIFQDGHRGADDSLPEEAEYPELAALEEAYEEAGDRDWDAHCNVISTVPTTLAGLRALVEYAASGDLDLTDEVR